MRREGYPYEHLYKYTREQRCMMHAYDGALVSFLARVTLSMKQLSPAKCIRIFFYYCQRGPA